MHTLVYQYQYWSSNPPIHCYHYCQLLQQFRHWVKRRVWRWSKGKASRIGVSASHCTCQCICDTLCISSEMSCLLACCVYVTISPRNSCLLVTSLLFTGCFGLLLLSKVVHGYICWKKWPLQSWRECHGWLSRAISMVCEHVWNQIGAGKSHQ